MPRTRRSVREGEVGFELAAVAAGGDILELDHHVATGDARDGGAGDAAADFEIVGGVGAGLGSGFVEVADEGREDGRAGAGGQVRGESEGDGGGSKEERDD